MYDFCLVSPPEIVKIRNTSLQIMGWLFHDTVFILVLEVEFESYNVVNVPIFCN